MRNDNKLYLGDNLQVIRNHIADRSIDLIYLDPPFASDADYSYVSADSIPGRACNSVTAFVDTWEWTSESKRILDDLRTRNATLADLLGALANGLRNNGLAAYLVMMGVRLLELRRVLKTSGSLYLHCDASASSYLRVIMDAILGAENFRNEIVWKRTSSHNDSKKWAHIHDTLLFYAGRGFTWNPVYLAHDPEYVRKFYRFEDARGRYRLHEIIRTASMGPRPNLAYEYKGYRPEWGWRMVRDKVERLDAEDRLTWSSTGRPYLKRYLHEQKGTPCPGLWLDIPPLCHTAAERLGYPTQKPLALLERIIAASSRMGDVVLDPFAGCGTSTHAAQKMGRKWIAIDQSALAVGLLRKRLEAHFPDCSYEINIKSTPVRSNKQPVLAIA
ncbi:site-specific DNA-methyltransferase [Acidithiobacillus thiooxidans]|uniref:Methyltransferase n=1 Tax=Acidithiobacillus thiooxidans ATCC 19377 TaxID=637390 RepID=A0A5P9XPY3_ACITH|nr:site-specific DNA-methyltransferase [Acidithiobacillus thiooxidans]QFX96065.1 adenine specific DNA methylase Mod [Acidithiobacillus thiooxidans ATCC 19377]